MNISVRMLPIQIIPPRQDPLETRCKFCEAVICRGSVIVLGIVNEEIRGFLVEKGDHCCQKNKSWGAKFFLNLNEADDYIKTLERTKYNEVIKNNLSELTDLLEAAGLTLKDLQPAVIESIKRERELN